jgi:hypothetical protein
VFNNIFSKPSPKDPPVDENKRIKGRIIHVEKGAGWGFISSPEIPFTRIFFHWTALTQDTLNFTQLEKNMMVEFNPKVFDGSKHRAIKLRVIEEVKENG